MKSVEYILNEIDIKDGLAWFGVDLKQYGHNFKTVCPIHSDSDPSFTVTQGKNTWYCFGCRNGGSLITFVQRYLKLNRIQAIKEIAKYDEVVEQLFAEDVAEFGETKHSIMEDAWSYFKNYKNESRDEFFKERGIIPDIYKKYSGCCGPVEELHSYLRGLGYSKEEIEFDYKFNEAYTDTIVYPMRNRYGYIAYFVCRKHISGEYISGDSYLPSYKNKLMFLSEEIIPQKTLILVEGMNDCLAAKQYFSNVVAMTGLAFTTQFFQFLKYNEIDDVVFWTDGDSAGIKFLETMGLEYKQFTSKGIVAKAVNITGFDPDQVILHSPNSVQELINKADLIPVWYLKSVGKHDSEFSLVKRGVDLIKELDTITSEIVIEYMTSATKFNSDQITDIILEQKDFTSSYNEKALISMVLSDIDLAAKYQIKPTWFSFKSTRELFEIIIKKKATWNTIKSFLKVDWLRRIVDELEEIQYHEYDHFVSAVKDFHLKRTLIGKMRLVVSKNLTYEESVAEINSLFTGVELADDTVVSITQSFKNTIDEMMSDTVAGLPFGEGWERCTNLLFGLLPKRLYMVAGPTGHGKTNVALNWVKNISITDGKKGLFMSGEMSAEEITQRLISMELGINAADLISKNVSDADMSKIMELSKVLQDNLYISTTMDFDKIVYTIKYMKAKHDIDYVVLDYVQLVNPNYHQSKMDRPMQLKDMSRQLKVDIAKALDIPVLMLSQLADQALDDPLPLARRSSESRLMTSDCDVIIGMRRKTKKEMDAEPNTGNMIFYIDKVRYNRRGVVIPVQFYDRNLSMKEVR